MVKSNNLVKPTILITIFSIFGIAISFVSQLVIAYFFGTKFERDAYFVVASIPTYITVIFTGSLGIIFLPKIIEIQKKGELELSNFISTILLSVLIILISITFFCILFSENIIHLIAKGFNTKEILFSSKLLLVCIPSIIFSVLSNLLSSLYQIEYKFIKPAIGSLISSAISLISVILLSPALGIFSLAIGFLLGTIFTFIFLLPIIKNYSLRFKLNLTTVEIYAFIKTLLPLFLTGILFRSTTIFERMIASNLTQGSISYLGYSSQILTILATLTSSGIAITVYPTLSNYWSTRNTENLIRVLQDSIRTIVVLALPVAITIIFFGKFFISSFFERGAFNENATIGVYNALAWAMGAFIFQSIGSVLVKIFYISGKTYVISLIASIEIFLYILLGFILTKHFSYIGLSLALSISSGFNIFVSFWYIHNSLIRMNIFYFIFDLFKIFIIALFSSSLILLIIKYYQVNEGFFVFGFVFCSFFLYCCLGALFKIKEFLILVTYLKKLIGRHDRRN